MGDDPELVRPGINIHDQIAVISAPDMDRTNTGVAVAQPDKRLVPVKLPVGAGHIRRGDAGRQFAIERGHDSPANRHHLGGKRDLQGSAGQQTQFPLNLADMLMTRQLIDVHVIMAGRIMKPGRRLFTAARHARLAVANDAGELDQSLLDRRRQAEDTADGKTAGIADHPRVGIDFVAMQFGQP